MIPSQKSQYFLRLLADSSLLLIMFFLSAVAAQSLAALRASPLMFVLAVLLLLLWYFTTTITGFYEEFRHREIAGQFLSLCKNTFAQAVAGVLFIFIVKELLFTRNFILYYAAGSTVLITLRVLAENTLGEYRRRKGLNTRKLIIIGTGTLAREFYDVTRLNPSLGFTFAGYVDDSGENVPAGHYLGALKNLGKIIAAEKPNEVVVALQGYEAEKMDSIIRVCNNAAVRTYIIPDYFRFLSKKFRVSMIGNFPILSVRNEPLAELHWKAVKRAVDILVSLLIILLVFSWLFPVIMLLQKILSPGPVFFIQLRIGKDNTVFRCYKFRSMTFQKEGKGKFKPAVEEDDRITPFGRVLRKFNIDELPQFINVLIGDMSLVGPRPHALAYNDVYKEFIEGIKLRNLVKPGITGWAQVHGLRGDVLDPEENKKRILRRIEYDVWYVENWSVWLDVHILLLTAWQILKGEARGT